MVNKKLDTHQDEKVVNILSDAECWRRTEKRSREFHED